MNSPQKLPAIRALFVLLYLFAALPQDKADAASIKPLSMAPPNVGQAFQQVMADFNLYQQFLQVQETPGGQVLLNARNPDEASIFLSRGFCDDLADAICASFTWYDRERGRLMLIPCDGLPTIGPAQKNDVLYYMEGQDLLTFQYRFENCYQPGDAYLYSVRTRLQDGWWKVEALELLKLNQ
ncbi:MAG: hypothetical protein ABFD04_03315 [Syntrophomonas sp.]